MRIAQMLKSKTFILAIVTGAVCMLGPAVKAHHGGADPYHYSAWTEGIVPFTVNGQGWQGHRQGVWTTHPDQARAYFCQVFGFFNCQVPGPVDTWIRSAGECWAGAIGSGTSTVVISGWSQHLPQVSCPAGKTNLGRYWVQVASIPFVF